MCVEGLPPPRARVLGEPGIEVVMSDEISNMVVGGSEGRIIAPE